jgi:mono/diheme cytochrome c family protein
MRAANSRALLLAACAIACAGSLAQPRQGPQPARGELLYSTHCIACHTTQIHWRAKKVVVDWPSLKAEVRRWSGNGGLGWSEEEIVEVARYLNATIYRFPAQPGTELGRRQAPGAGSSPG